MFVHGIIFISTNLSVHLMKLHSFKEIYSFKENIFVQVQDLMFIQGNYIFIQQRFVRGHSRNIYS